MLKLGIVKKKVSWCLTYRGWVVVVVVFLGTVCAVIRLTFPFLAITEPVRADVLVLEAWLPDFCLPDVKLQFRSGGYKKLLLTGGTIDRGEPFAEYDSYPEMMRSILLKQGWEEAQLIAVSSTNAKTYRTYASALAFKKWLSQSEMEIPAINIYSLGPHARRTRLTFQRVLGDRVKVGVIAGKDPRYDGNDWFKTSEGTSTVLYQSLAYLYSLLFATP